MANCNQTIINIAANCNDIGTLVPATLVDNGDNTYTFTDAFGIETIITDTFLASSIFNVLTRTLTLTLTTGIIYDVIIPCCSTITDPIAGDGLIQIDYNGTIFTVATGFTTIVEDPVNTFTGTEPNGNVTVWYNIGDVETITDADLATPGSPIFSDIAAYIVANGPFTPGTPIIYIGAGTSDNPDYVWTINKDLNATNIESPSDIDPVQVLTDADLATAGEPISSDIDNYITANGPFVAGTLFIYIGNGTVDDPDYVWTQDKDGTATNVESPPCECCPKVETPAGDYTIVDEEYIFAAVGSTITFPQTPLCYPTTVCRDDCSDGEIQLVDFLGNTLFPGCSGPFPSGSTGCITLLWTGTSYITTSTSIVTSAGEGKLPLETGTYYTGTSCITVSTFTGADWTIDWGDGTPIETYGAGATVCRTLGTGISDTLTFNTNCGVGEISAIILDNVGNSMTIEDFEQFENLEYLTITGGVVGGGGGGISGGFNGGDIANLPSCLIELIIDGGDFVGGQLVGFYADLPSTLEVFDVSYFAMEIIGVTTDLPPGLLYFSSPIDGGELGGNVTGLPVGLTHYEIGSIDEVTGDYIDLPSTLITYIMRGSASSISGDFADLPVGLLHYEYKQDDFGQPTTAGGGYGDIATLPPGLEYFSTNGRPPGGLVTGDLSSLPATLIYFKGDNEISTDLLTAGLPVGLNNFYYRSLLGTPLSTVTVDAVLASLVANGPLTVGLYLNVDLQSFNGAPTPAGQANAAILTGNGWTVATA